MLEHHAHMPAVYIDIHAHIRNIHTIEHNTASGRVLHTVQTTQKRTLSRPGRPDYRHNITLIDGNVDSLENLHIPKALPEINYVYHSSSSSFPSISQAAK